MRTYTLQMKALHEGKAPVTPGQPQLLPGGSKEGQGQQGEAVAPAGSPQLNTGTDISPAG